MYSPSCGQVWCKSDEFSESYRLLKTASAMTAGHVNCVYATSMTPLVLSDEVLLLNCLFLLKVVNIMHL